MNREEAVGSARGQTMLGSMCGVRRDEVSTRKRAVLVDDAISGAPVQASWE